MIKILKAIYRYTVKPFVLQIKNAVKKRPKKKGINLVGYFDAPIGTSEVGRQCFLDIVKFNDLPVKIISYDLPSYEKQGFTTSSDFAPWVSKNYSLSTNLLFFNADSISDFKKHHLSLETGLYNVGIFWWELEDYFYYDEGVNAADEIFVFSDFIKNAILKNYPGKKVTKFSFPYYMPDYKFDDKILVKKTYGIKEDSFVFFFNFDFYSVYERKNPEGLLKAFSIAFKDNPNVTILFKTIHGNKHIENYDKFQKLISNYGIEKQIILLDRNMEKRELMNLLNASDCYVSLHRSEGLGIGMMEAMLLKKPVIATAYGGNMEFTKEENSLLVNYTLTSIGEGAEPYKKEYKWANPDVEDAAIKMKNVYEDVQLRNRLAKKGHEYIISNHYNGKFAKELASWFNHKL